MTTLDKLESLAEDDSDTIRPFMPYEEEAIVALALDHPEFFTIAAQFLKQEMFGKLSVRYIIANLLQVFELHDTIPTRQYFETHLKKTLTEDDAYDEIFRIVRTKSNPRDIPLLKDTILKWAKNRAYGRLFAPDALAAYNRNDFTYIDDLVRDANRIADVGDFGFWFLDRYEELFEPEAIEHRTTGFAKLDKLLNNGGPSPKEVVCWLASTGLGKCHTLQSKIFVSELSHLYELEFENGEKVQVSGITKINTERGIIRVCDLTEDDNILEIPITQSWDIQL